MKTLLLLLFLPFAAPAQAPATLYRVNDEAPRPDTLRADEHWHPGADKRVMASLRSPRAFLYCDTLLGDSVTLIAYNGTLWLKRLITADAMYAKNFHLSAVELDLVPGPEIRLDWLDAFSHSCATYANSDHQQHLLVVTTTTSDVLLDLVTGSDTRYESSDPPGDREVSWCSKHYTVRMGRGWVSCFRTTYRGSADKNTFGAEDCGVSLPQGTFRLTDGVWTEYVPPSEPKSPR